MGIRSFFPLITLLALPGCIPNVLGVKKDTPPCRAYTESMDLSSAMKGYDVWKANPWNPDGGDPGVRTTIFLHKCQTSSKEPGFYDFIEVNADPSCSTDFSVETITTFQEYMGAQSSSVSVDKEVSASVSVETPWVDVSASYSTSSSDSKEEDSLKKFFQQQAGEVALAQASCYTNDFQLGIFLRPVFHKNFIAALKKLNKSLSGPISHQKKQFKKFIGEFGTHYAKQVDYGARLIHSTFYNQRSKTSQEAATRKGCAGKASSACVGAKGSGFGVSVNAEACYAEETKKCEAKATDSSTGGTNSVEKTKILSVGSRPLSQGDWITSDFNAVPIKRSLQLISTLFQDEWLSENEAYGFDVSLDGAGLRKLFNSLIVDYCTIILGHSEKQCHEKQKGCGINDDCGYRQCKNMPDSEKGYECGSTQGACDRSATTITSCKLDIDSPWVIHQDTVLSNVEIHCKTTGQGCIYIAYGSHVTIMYASAQGDGRSRFIDMASNSKLTITDTGISNFISQGDNGAGGAILAPGKNFLQIKNSEFKLNKAAGEDTYGGAISMDNSGELSVTGTKFVGNKATGGGAIYVKKSKLVFDNILFESNEATYGGGVYLYQSSYSISNTMFRSNKAQSGGGGMSVYECQDVSVGTIHKVTFQGNVLGKDYEIEGSGGGLWIGYSNVQITQSAFIGNRAIKKGGGMFIYGEKGDTNRITMNDNNIFYNNAANLGEAIYCNWGNLNIGAHTVKRDRVVNTAKACKITYG